MTAGKPKKVEAGVLFSIAHQFYWDFRRLAEAGHRWQVDTKKEQQLYDALKFRAPSPAQKSRLNGYTEYLDRETRMGRLQEEDSPGRSGRRTLLRQSRIGHATAQREWARSVAAREAQVQIKIPGEPGVLKLLLQEDNPSALQKICETSPNWPIPYGSALPFYLSNHAREFIAAKLDRRFPASSRPSNRLKQLWFLSRALAGAVFGIKTRTAINLVGSKLPDQIFTESRDAKPSRKKRR
jgi:hypothetical protein